MLKSNQEQPAGASGTSQVVRIAIFLGVILFLSGAVTTVQAQKIPYSLTTDGMYLDNLHGDPTAYYLPYDDGDRLSWSYFYPCFRPGCHGRRYSGGYWYPWTFRWGRYDVPNYTWWSFGEGFVDEYGTGGVWTASDPRKTTELKAIQTVERERVAARMRNEAPRVTGRRGMGSTGISTSRGSSISSSGRGSSIGSSGGGGGRGGKK